jgi:hypothetical protein
MNTKHAFAQSTAALLMAIAATPAIAAHTIDTGSPDASFAGYAFDGNDFYAGLVQFATDSRIDSIATHLIGGNSGETFTVALYSEAANLPDAVLYAAQGSFGADGWNGASGLSGWNVTSGTHYWVAFEISGADTLSPFAVLDGNVPTPLTKTAFNAGSGYTATTVSMGFGVRVDAVSAVPEPSSLILMAGGLFAVVSMALRRRS